MTSPAGVSRRASSSGFTLVELLLVLVLLSAVAGMVAPRLAPTGRRVLLEEQAQRIAAVLHRAQSVAQREGLTLVGRTSADGSIGIEGLLRPPLDPTDFSRRSALDLAAPATHAVRRWALKADEGLHLRLSDEPWIIWPSIESPTSTGLRLEEVAGKRTVWIRLDPGSGIPVTSASLVDSETVMSKGVP